MEIKAGTQTNLNFLLQRSSAQVANLRTNATAGKDIQNGAYIDSDGSRTFRSMTVNSCSAKLDLDCGDIVTVAISARPRLISQTQTSIYIDAYDTKICIYTYEII